MAARNAACRPPTQARLSTSRLGSRVKILDGGSLEVFGRRRGNHLRQCPWALHGQRQSALDHDGSDGADRLGGCRDARSGLGPLQHPHSSRTRTSTAHIGSSAASWPDGVHLVERPRPRSSRFDQQRSVVEDDDPAHGRPLPRWRWIDDGRGGGRLPAGPVDLAQRVAVNSSRVVG